MPQNPITEQQEQEVPQQTLNITHSYPVNDDYYYTTELERLNLDKTKVEYIYRGDGFIISEPQSIKKDIKDANGIFSPRFGQGLSDVNPYIDRYSCECGNLKSSINFNQKCPLCNTRVKYVGDNYKTTGWIQLLEYHIIHPNLYSAIEYFFGPSNGTNDKDNRHINTKLFNIIKYAVQADQDGKLIIEKPENLPNDQPFYGIGMIEFYERFDEIMEFYRAKYPKKEEYYQNIMQNRDKVFIQSIPVITTHLRPFDVKNDFKNQTLYFEPINGMYNMMNNLAAKVNKSVTAMDRKKKPKNNLLFDLQMEYQKLYDEVINILSGKKGQLRQLTGGRFNFSSRSVIAQDPSLRIDQVKLPYAALTIMLQQKIINILGRMYHISPSEAYNMWYRSQSQYDPKIADIIMSIIKSRPEGLPVIINRNPTIAYGSILQCFCVGINDNFTMSISLQVLRPMAADFDGDVLNIIEIINEAFFQSCYNIFNPRNAMYISHDNGLFNIDVCIERDSVINANTLMNLGRKNYTEKQLRKIHRLKKKAMLT